MMDRRTNSYTDRRSANAPFMYPWIYCVHFHVDRAIDEDFRIHRVMKQKGCLCASACPLTFTPKFRLFCRATESKLSNEGVECTPSKTSRKLLWNPLGMKNSSTSSTATYSARPLDRYRQVFSCSIFTVYLLKDSPPMDCTLSIPSPL